MSLKLAYDLYFGRSEALDLDILVTKIAIFRVWNEFLQLTISSQKSLRYYNIPAFYKYQ